MVRDARAALGAALNGDPLQELQEHWAIRSPGPAWVPLGRQKIWAESSNLDALVEPRPGSPRLADHPAMRNE
eukprot:CAMPEP_0174301134 /NCGR_PEP_ID=MMETSP0809-20121228/58867_1 /TAXON_ID=73025 ORGANISM="Eutreptiella gymnastica-like, Strain CCMP1594" /NCGR_SAMPLE_ID=MMETSP0809 /ASSEMBLY_ACC=CAM_ASM_000658 /LENGTH=71 /DNA_ID=CAMNT_0015406823 /DNA_START=1500 /DNA_END=1714 /DNA_ORIENTATION=-